MLVYNNPNPDKEVVVMIEPDQHAKLKKAILQRIQTDRFLLDQRNRSLPWKN